MAVSSRRDARIAVADGTIIFGAGGASPLFRVAATGGTAQRLTQLRDGQQSHRFPQVLPGGRHILYYAIGTPEVRGVHVAPLDGSDAVRLLDADTAAAYAPPGRLLFVRQGTLFAQNFDASSRVLSGEPFHVAEQIARDPLSIQLAAMSASAAGPIAYRPGGVGIPRRLVWFDRSGKEIGQLDDQGASVNNPTLSTDGRHAAWDHATGANVDIWTMNLERGNPDRLTSNAEIDAYPIWSPDGARLAFGSIRGSAMNLYQRPVTSSGEEETLLVTSDTKAPTDWSSDGRFILFRNTGRETGYDLWALPMNAEGPGKPFAVVQTAFDERDGQFSPDGNWIAYQSNESDRTEVYIQRFPSAGRKIRISPGGGAQPRWSRNGRELFYVSLDGRLMAAPLTLGADSEATKVGTPVPLFFAHVGSALQGAARQQYMTASDGQRFSSTRSWSRRLHPSRSSSTGRARPRHEKKRVVQAYR